MRREIATVFLCIFLMFTSIVFVNEFSDYVTNVKGDAHYVNETGSNGAFTSIQDAINASKDGDTVFVYSGIYYENIIVNKTINLTGEDKNSTIIDGKGIGDIVVVIANFANISGFSMRNGGTGWSPDRDSGIELNKVSNCRIFNNKVFESGLAINIHYSHDNNITGNNISNNADGIWLRNSTNNSITYNTILYSGVAIDGEDSSNNNTVSHNDIFYNEDGIWFLYSSNNTISNNNCINNDWYGIYLDYSDNSSIVNNNCSNGYLGIEICDSSDITATGNTILSNEDYGIMVQNAFYINATNNNISGSWYGIWLFNLVFGDISNNNISSKENGIELVATSLVNVTHNNVRDSVHGIIFWSGYENNIMANNSLSYNSYGIWYDGSEHDIISGNIVFNNSYGIHLWESSYLDITDNHVFNNDYGIYYWEDTIYTNITDNNVSNNECGIFLDKSFNDYNIISENLVAYNEFGLNISQSNNNIIFHNNFINNTYMANDDSVNKWDNDYPLGGNYWSDYDGVDYYKGPYQNMPGADGIGDTNYSIDFDTVDNYPLMEPYKFKILENCTILLQGWNLISVPLIQDNQNITKVLEMIDGYYDIVQWYDASDKDDPWKNYIVDKPFGNDLLHLNETMGFWIRITHSGGTIFLYNGTAPSVNQIIQLYKGWNMVGYPSLTDYNRTNGLNNLTFGTHVDAIWTYNASTQKWKELGESDYFERERGYYIHAMEECEWEVPL
ncbi:MAG: right-handed parallel beta-helix repeat-containing protein [Thermoplasmata archaeon]|nr:MAG: right-handed parallel beta-helix repeat-containing protein [Thermoplasmata archaeon]